MTEVTADSLRGRLVRLREESRDGIDLHYAVTLSDIVNDVHAYAETHGDNSVNELHTLINALVDGMVAEALARLQSRARGGDMGALDVIAQVVSDLDAESATAALLGHIAHTYHLTLSPDDLPANAVKQLSRVLTAEYEVGGTMEVIDAYWVHVLTRAEHGIEWALDALASELVRSVPDHRHPKWQRDPVALLQAARALAHARLGRRRPLRRE